MPFDILFTFGNMYKSHGMASSEYGECSSIIILVQHSWIVIPQIWTFLLHPFFQLLPDIDVLLLYYYLALKYPPNHDDILNTKKKNNENYYTISTWRTGDLPMNGLMRSFRIVLENTRFSTWDDFFYQFRLCCELPHDIEANDSPVLVTITCDVF